MIAATTTTTTIVFITGAFVTHHIWDGWINYFTGKGFNCIAPAWPYKDGTAEELRNRRPNDTDLAGLRLQELLDHYSAIIQRLPEKPIVIGHSLGGLLVQLLVNKDLVTAGIAIHSVPPKGVTSFKWSFIKSIWKPLGYFTSAKKTHLMSLAEWKYAFTNGMSEQEQKESYEKNVIPESKRVLRDVLTKAAKVDFKKPRPPMLFISGSTDNIIPESLNYDNYLKYDRSHSVTGYKEFAGKNHFVPGLPSWHDEAGYIIEWLQIAGV